MTAQIDNTQDKNLSAVFNVFDVNRDKKITAEDFAMLSKVVCEQFGLTMDSDQGQQIREGYQAWWNQLRQDFDTDNDGQVTMAEFAAAYQGGQGDPQEYYNKHAAPIINLVLEMVDTDKDGYIGEDEYLNFVVSVGRVDHQAALAGFRQLDSNGDGQISVAEFQAGVQDLMLSNDASAPGTMILG